MDLTRSTLSSIAPFFIVRDIAPSTAYYRELLGFEVRFATPEAEPFFVIVGRDNVQIMLKAILPEVQPSPNRRKHPWAKWDAFINTADPDALAAEFSSRGVPMHAAVADTEDGLRGFEVQDPDGYVLFFGHPV